MACPLCQEPDLEMIEVRHALFRHLDFSTIWPSGRLARCENCQAVINCPDEREVEDQADHFRSREYAQCSTMSHTLFVKEYAQPVTRTFLQARLFKELLQGSSPTILDVGCFNGELLLEIDANFEAAELHGFDVNEHLRSAFPSAPNFHFWASSLSAVQGSFDLISISGAIVYMKDIAGLMTAIERLLKPDGMVFVQSVDIAESPYAILLGDQCYHFSRTILVNLFGSFGFQFTPLDNSWAPREVIGTFRRHQGSQRAVKFTEDRHVYQCVTHLDDMAERLRRMQVRADGGVGVLGTSAAAAFVDSVLAEGISFYVDENPNRAGGQFRGKRVLHPRLLDSSTAVLLPYGNLNERIKSRFEGQYHGRFIGV